MIILNEQIIEKLSFKGVLAYVAASYAGSGLHTTALLASAVGSPVKTMRDGLAELATHHPQSVEWVKKSRRWNVAGAPKPLKNVA